MKKTLAALGASLLGIGTVAVPATSAMAEPSPEPLPSCDTFADQLDSFGSFSEQWIGDCVPQYGLGKVEFTIVADEDDSSVEFPDDFVPLPAAFSDDSPVTATTTLDAEAMSAYFGAGVEGATLMPISAIEMLDESASSQTYGAYTFVPISGVGGATAENTPAAVSDKCGLTWPVDDAEPDFVGWFSAYDPVDTTYTQTTAGGEWSYEITGASNPSYFFIVEPEDADPSLCVTDGESVFTSDLDSLGSEAIFLLITAMPFLPEHFCTCEIPGSLEQALSELDVSSLPSFAAIGESGLFDLGTFGPAVAPVPPKPQLAATGSDGSALVVPAIIAGGIVIVGGTLITVALVRRRRNRA